VGPPECHLLVPSARPQAVWPRREWGDLTVLKNIWRPNDSATERPPASPETALTARLAELLGRSAPSSPTDSLQNRKRTRLPRIGAESGQVEPLAEQAPTTDGSPRNRATSVRAIARATEQALDQLHTVQQELEASLRSRVEHYGQALQTAFTELRERSLQSPELSQTLASLHETVQSWLAQAREELQREFEHTRRSVNAELEQARREFLAASRRQTEELLTELRQQIASDNGHDLVQKLDAYTEQARRQMVAAIATLGEAVEQGLARLRRAEQELDASLQKRLAQYQQAIAARLGDLPSGELSSESVHQFQQTLEQTVEQLTERSRQRLSEELDRAVAGACQRLAEAGQSVLEITRTSLEAELERHQQRLAEQERSVAAAVTETARQMTAELEAARHAAVEHFEHSVQEQIERIVATVTEELRARQVSEALVAEIQTRIERSADQTLTRTLAALEENARQAIAAVEVQLRQTEQVLFEQVRARFDAQSQTWIGEVADAVREAQAERLAAWLEEQMQSARRAAQAASEGVARLVEQALARIEQASLEAERSFREQLAAEQKQLLESVIAELRTGALRQQLLGEAAEELRQGTASVREQTMAELQRQAQQSQAAFAAELGAAVQKRLAQVGAELEQLSLQHRNKLHQWWEQRQHTMQQQATTVARLLEHTAAEAAEQLRSTQKTLALELQQQLQTQRAEMAQQVLEDLRRSGALEPLVRETARQLEDTAQRLIERTVADLRQQLEAARSNLEEQTRASRRQLSEEILQLTEQAQASVESSGKAVTDEFRRQMHLWWEERTQVARREAAEAASALSRLSEQTAERMRVMLRELEAETGKLFEHFRSELRQAAAEEIRRQGFQQEALELIASEIDRTAHELAARTGRELQQNLEASLAGLTEQLRTSRESFLEETQKHLAELTRSALSMADQRFHEFLTQNVQQLEQEQEEWLQRRRQILWEEINRMGAVPPAGAPARRASANTAESKSGPPSATRRSVTGLVGTAVGVVALAGLLTVAFVQLAPKPTVTVELRADPPQGFIENRPEWSPRQRARQEQLARAYWKIAASVLESKYSYGVPLPAEPPPEFQVNENGLKDDPATRAYYWEKLRAAWLQPENWKNATPADSGWLASLMDRLRSVRLNK
jgi:hypothetical protein